MVNHYLTPGAIVDSSHTWDETQTFADDTILAIGTGGDGAIVHRSAILNANTALTGVLIGTPVTPALPANSTIISNVTASGDILVATRKGSNSLAGIWLDGSAGDTSLLAASGQSVDTYIGGAKEIDYATGEMTFLQATIISTSSGILSLDAGTTSIRLNEAGADIDVVIEGANNTTLLHTNAGTDTVGIGGSGLTESMLGITTGAVGHNLYTQYGTAINVISDTLNDTGGGATDAIIPTVSIGIITYTGSNANTYTDVASLYIQGVPVAGSNTTFTNTALAFWVDAGASRFDGAISLGTDHGDDGQQLTSGGDDAACDWTAASSLREHKDIGSEADPGQALQVMLDSTAYHFRYKEKHGTGDSVTEYVGLMADDAPWAMHYKGTIVNPVNTLGYTVLAVQALNDKIERLESLLAKEV